MQDPVHQAPHELTVQDYLGILVRRRKIFLLVCLVVCAGGAVFTHLTRPIYRATTSIVVANANPWAVADLGKDVPFGDLIPATNHDVDTQIEMLKSQRVLRDACDILADMPDKNATDPHGENSIRKEILQRLAEMRIDLKLIAPGDVDKRPDGLRAAIGKTVMIDASQVQRTDIIGLNVDAPNTQWAQSLALVLPVALQKYERENRKSGIERALAYVRREYDGESGRLKIAEMALNQFKRDKKVVDLPVERATRVQQAITMEENSRTVEADLAGKQGELNALVEASENLPPFVETTVKQTNNAERATLEAQLTDLQNQRSGLLARLEPTHPKVQEIDARIADLQTRLSALAKEIVTDTHATNPKREDYASEIAKVRGQIASDIASLAKLRALSNARTQGLDQYRAMEIKGAELEREVQRHAAAEQDLAKTQQALSVRANAADDPVDVISQPVQAIKVAPILVKNLFATLFLALLFAVGAAFLQEYLDDRVHSPEEAARYLDAPALGYVPLINKKETVQLHKIGHGGGLLETYRMVRANVQFAAVDAPLRSLLVTSAIPGEGKTCTACNLAVASAMSGRRVALVDADLRRPAVHERFGCRKSPGLTNVLIGHLPLEAALQDTDTPGLRILTCGNLPPNPAELLSSRAMHDLLNELQARFDLVILDSPPILATADPLALADQTDGIVLVVQLVEIRRSALRVVGERLRQARARTLGVVYNKVNPRGMSGHGRNDYYHTYPYYSDYQSALPEDPQAHQRLVAEFEALPRKGRNGVKADQSATNGHSDPGAEA